MVTKHPSDNIGHPNYGAKYQLTHNLSLPRHDAKYKLITFIILVMVPSIIVTYP